MVSLSDVQQTNALAASKLPAGLVAVFAGATAGIGETALKAFAKHALRLKIYFIGRSQEAGDRLQIELRNINPEGSYVFVKKDMGLLENVDEVCRDIKSRETVLNLLFLSQGTLKMGVDTDEGLSIVMAVAHYSRARLTVNLLPLLRKASCLRRVVTVMAASTAPEVICVPPSPSLEALARQAPEVSFIHNFSGSVDTDLIRSGDGVMMQVMKYWFKVSMTVRRQWLPKEECGERHAWLCWSGMFPDRLGQSGNGVESAGGVAVGVDGSRGSGVYSLDWDGESAGDEVVKLLGEYRQEGMVDKVWKDLETEFVRITGETRV
ncbi:unnamed protein product [Fusarium langsethiae]|nr:unnamed protein product [Fusarium langsethiae]